MEFVHVAVVALGLLSVARSAPVTGCETLIQPRQIQGREQLLGKWFQVGESTNIAGSQWLVKILVETAWGKLSAATQDDGVDAYFAYKMLGRCFSLSTSYTLVNNTISMERPYVSSAVLLNTGCPDCLVFTTKATLGTATYSGLQLLSRRSKVTDAELEEFRKQVECLNLPSPVILDAEKGFCPDQPQSQETEIVDLTNAMNSMTSEALDLFNSFFNSEGGLKTLTNLVSSTFTAAKQN